MSDGRLRGRRLAVAGMVLGGLGTAVVLIWVVVVGLFQLQLYGYRTTCENNLRVVGRAVDLYYDKHRAYPSGTIPNGALRPDERLSWLVSILPYLPQEAGKRGKKPKDVFDAIDHTLPWSAPANAAAVNVSFRWFLCPSDPGTAPDRQPGQTSYVGLAGVGSDAAQLPTASPRAGMFGYERRVTREDVTAGISQTILATETALDNGPWAAGGPATIRALIRNDQPYIGPGRPFGGCHPEGLNILHVDGQVRFTRDTIPATTLEALATLAGD